MHTCVEGGKLLHQCKTCLITVNAELEKLYSNIKLNKYYLFQFQLLIFLFPLKKILIILHNFPISVSVAVNGFKFFPLMGDSISIN